MVGRLAERPAIVWFVEDSVIKLDRLAVVNASQTVALAQQSEAGRRLGSWPPASLWQGYKIAFSQRALEWPVQ